MPFDETFLEATIRAWQPLSRKPLTLADAHEIAESMTGLFAALARCAKEAGQASAQFPGRRDGS